jgi:hypothetical protein
MATFAAIDGTWFRYRRITEMRVRKIMANKKQNLDG